MVKSRTNERRLLFVKIRVWTLATLASREKRSQKKAISPSISANRALKRERGLFKAAPESQRTVFTAVPFNQGPGGRLGVERWKLGMSLRERRTTLLERIITREQRETLGN